MASTTLYKNAKKSARAAGLRYVSDQQPGVRRQRWGRGFSYIDVDGTRIKDKKRRAQFEALVIPPSWRDVWICCDENGHLRATGRDLKGRKQYRYHPEWIALRKQLKFDRLIPFAEALPTLRQKTQAEIDRATGDRTPKLTRPVVIAAVVQLLDNTFIRIGNQQYAQANDAYGATTLESRHANISSQRIELQFIGKSGVHREIDLCDAQLAKIVKRCQEIPGQPLFQYIDAAGDHQAIDSGDVNEYLQTVMGSDFTAKDFRTWGGTVTAAQMLYEKAEKINASQADKPPEDADIVEAIKMAASQLGNRPATCRKYYIHPRIFDLYKAGTLVDAIAHHSSHDQVLSQFLHTDEQRTLAILCS